MRAQPANDNVVRLIQVPVDPETAALLDAFARLVRKNPAHIAGELLREVLRDDAQAHGLSN